MPKHEPVMTGTKVCTKCEVEKSVLEFYKHKKTLDGRAGSCRECGSAQTREYRSNPAVKERYRLNTERWRLSNEHPEAKMRWWDYTYRRKKLGLPLLGEPVVTMAGLIELYGPYCFYCEKPLRFDIPRWVTADHVFPVSHPDSRHDYSMMVASCRACNFSKHARSLEEWRGETEAAWLWQRIADVQHRVPDVMRFV